MLFYFKVMFDNNDDDDDNNNDFDYDSNSIHVPANSHACGLKTSISRWLMPAGQFLMPD